MKAWKKLQGILHPTVLSAILTIVNWFRLFFGERNVEGMLRILDPLHQMMQREPQTLKETSFTQAYGRDLTEAYKLCQKYRASGI